MDHGDSNVHEIIIHIYPVLLPNFIHFLRFLHYHTRITLIVFPTGYDDEGKTEDW